MSKTCLKESLAGLLILILVYAFGVIARPTISPEICLAYLSLTNIHNLPEVLHKFLVVNETWYRPLTFYLTNYILFHIIDFHSIYLIKTVSTAMILVNGFVVTRLAKSIFDSSTIERIFIFALAVTHPLYFSVAYEGSGIVDPIFIIFLNLFTIYFLRLLEQDRHIILTATDMRYRVWLASLCCVLTFCTITAQERGMEIFALMVALYLYNYRHQFAFHTMLSNRPAVSVIVFNSVLFAIYMFFVYLKKPSLAGQEYRTGFEVHYVFPNILKSIELPLRLFFYKIGKGYDAHCEWGFNLLALPSTAALISYLWSTSKGHDKQEKSRLGILGIVFLCSLPIPILFGGNVWHFYPAALYMSIVTGRALWFWFQKADSRLQPYLLAIFFLWLSVATIRGIEQELDGTDLGNYMKIVPNALNDNTLKQISFVPDVVYYDTGSYGDFTWPFGGQGHLFRYLYKNPELREIALVNGKVLTSDRPFCDNVAGKKTEYFGFNAEDLSWHTIAERNYCAE